MVAARMLVVAVLRPSAALHTHRTVATDAAAPRDCWEVASQMPALLHTLVAVFAVKHEVVAIPRSTCNETIALLEALGASTIDHDSLIR